MTKPTDRRERPSWAREEGGGGVMAVTSLPRDSASHADRSPDGTQKDGGPLRPRLCGTDVGGGRYGDVSPLFVYLMGGGMGRREPGGRGADAEHPRAGQAASLGTAGRLFEHGGRQACR